MSRIIADKQDIIAIANATRIKTGKNNPLTLQEIANEINSISGGNGATIQTASVTFPGTCLGGETIHYIGSDGSAHQLVRYTNQMETIEVMKDTFIYESEYSGIFDGTTYVPEPDEHFEILDRDGSLMLIKGNVIMSYADGAPS